jgi:DNA-binding XRE family transcriptional regulator
MKVDIKRHRLAVGMTQTELADAMGVKQSTVCAWEIGARNPSTKHLVKLSALFRVPIEKLIMAKGA